MIRDIIGEWDVSIVEKGTAQSVGRLSFRLAEGVLRVVATDPDAAGPAARVDVDGSTLRFELLAAGSSRGVTRHVYEVSLLSPSTFGGSRRRGMMARVPVTGQRVNAMPGGAFGSSLAEAKARAAEAAERATQAAAEAAAALAEVEAASALEAARRAAEKAASARAAALGSETPAVLPTPPSGRRAVPPEVLAILPAPTQPAAFGSRVSSDATVVALTTASSVRRVRATHLLSCGETSLLAVEVHPGVFVWGESFPATAQRLREVGWTVVPVQSDQLIAIGETQLAQASTVARAVAG
ncbi:hypothetical protein [Salinibacterium sp. ZJ70]|uniref:hypothetical protein n=1 Tax=Salinibacterium sp. ZJ70 TaxID=2708084 RepID=UPI0014246136|nr:hypothetical protein [Salinibacterium sp. ZJ70]